MDFQHRPVLLEEVIKHLNIQPAGIYLDATFGRGGHAQAILAKLDAHGRLLAMDKDPQACALGKKMMSNDRRFIIQHGSFAHILQFARDQDIVGRVDGLLLDLGVSSPQLDDPARGFSFLREGPLDMRMDPSAGIDAATWLEQASQDQIMQVLRDYGQERFAKRVARAIVSARNHAPIKNTSQLAQIIAQAIPTREKGKHPATRSFQGIRIFINNELQELSQCLAASLSILKKGGRLLVISFHSLEDKIVKRFMRQILDDTDVPRGLPIRGEKPLAKIKQLVAPIRPTTTELAINPRARSAILRVAEKIG